MPFFDDEEFVTGFLADVSEPDRVTLVSCGHPPPILVRRDGLARSSTPRWDCLSASVRPTTRRPCRGSRATAC